VSIFLPFLKFFGGKEEAKSLPYRVSERNDATAAWTTAVKRAELSFFLVLRQVVKERR
jgi:hypothetical protein